MQIQIDGLDNAERLIKQYSAQAAEKLHRGLVKGTRIVQNEARAECPVDTGTLRRSIHGQVDGTDGVVGTNTEYAGYVEFGTYKMAAKPYLAPALKSHQSDIIAAIAAEFKR